MGRIFLIWVETDSYIILYPKIANVATPACILESLPDAFGICKQEDKIIVTQKSRRTALVLIPRRNRKIVQSEARSQRK